MFFIVSRITVTERLIKIKLHTISYIKYDLKIDLYDLAILGILCCAFTHTVVKVVVFVSFPRPSSATASVVQRSALLREVCRIVSLHYGVASSPKRRCMTGQRVAVSFELGVKKFAG